MQATKQPLPIAEDKVRAQLKKIVASPGFFRAARMQRFLTFIVEGRLDGKHNPEELKESIVGMAVFDRHAAYDPKSDPVVRVEARRLRSKLEEYYEGPGKGDDVRINLPKGSYMPLWEWQNEPVTVVEPPQHPPAIRSLKPRLLAAGLFIALLILAAGMYKWRERLFALRPVTSADQKIRSLAVLPFRNLSSDPKQEYLVSGLTDEIITDLAKIKSLTVISRTSTECYRASTKHLPEIARELHVDAIVEGTVGSSGKRLRVTAQLIRAATDSHLWAETYERDATDIFALQTEIAQDIAQQIGVALNPPTTAAGDHPANATAYETYLRGRYFWDKRTLDGLEKSIAYYRQAIQLDPAYAKAYAAMADSYVLLSSYGGPSPSESLLRARDAAERALKLDAGLAEAYTALAAVKIDHDWDWQGATREFERALELSPSYPTAHHWYALHLSRLGHHKRAEAQIQRALELDPLSLIINTDAGEVFYAAKDPDRAMFFLRRVLELDPNFAEAHLVLGKVYEEKHELAQATAEFNSADRLFNDAPNLRALQGHVLALSGKRAEALDIARKLEEDSKARYVSGVDIAMVYCALGDTDRGMRWLDHAYQNDGKGLNIIGSDPLFDGCRADPRFKVLLKNLHLSR